MTRDDNSRLAKGEAMESTIRVIFAGPQVPIAEVDISILDRHA
jgi:hypothetical protein